MAIKYVCTKKCFHKLKLYRVGNYAIFNSAKDGPQDKKGRLINFEPIEVVGPTPKPEVSVKVNNQVV